jgi:nitrate reductase gamma subunit
MTAALFLLIYAACLVFLIASIVRAVRYAKMPVHLRWELYPVPHEEPERVEHGGSYFEDVDWWTKPRHRNLAGEMKFMVPEMVFLKGLWEFNRDLWFRSFPFHFGIYLTAAAATLIAVSAAIDLTALSEVSTWIALAGLTLILLGAAGLLHRRLSDRRLRNYTAPADIFNLVFFLLVSGLFLAGYFSGAAGAGSCLAIARGLIVFDTSLEIPPLVAAGLGLGALLVAYIPLTHMSHFIAKYFTYHRVRWDDAPLAGNRRTAVAMASYLAYRPTWAADHMKAGGAGTWAEIVSSNPTREEKR